MDIKIDNIDVIVPDHVSNVTLRSRIDFDLQYGDELNERVKEIQSQKLSEESTKLLLNEVYIDRAQKSFAFFSGLDLEVVQRIMIGDVVKLYEMHIASLVELPMKPSGVNTYLVNDQVFLLPEPVLTPNSPFTFNELITAKEISRNMNSCASEKLQAIAYLGVIFFRRMNDKFIEADLNEEENKLEFILDLPITTAMQIALFYDQWSQYIESNFSVFEKSKIKGGVDMSAHFEKWGWISFLNYVAQKGTIFYKSNSRSNLDNVKEANCYEVLVWASCEKDQEDIIAKYYEDLERKTKRA